MNDGEIIIFDPYGELLKIAAEIEQATKDSTQDMKEVKA